jgi:diaminopimelate epimerase
MRLEFTKMHGLGNDFIVFDAPSETPLPSNEQFRRLAARHTGVGFDQALVIEPPRRAGTVAFYRIFNADGGEVEQCGNGARCVAVLLRKTGRAQSGDITMDSPAGLIRARIEANGLVSVDMGLPDFRPAALPFSAAAEADEYTLDVGSERLKFGAVSIGNPHAVLMVPSVAMADVTRIGPLLEQHPAFANRVNVGFMEIAAPDQIRLRVFERGVGETLACGTGACAAVAVGQRRGRLVAKVRVQVPGGELVVSWQGPGQSIWLTGPAEIAFEGRTDI